MRTRAWKLLTVRETVRHHAFMTPLLNVENTTYVLNDDLFDGTLTFREIAGVFGVMGATPWHRYLLAVRDPLRAAAWFERMRRELFEEGPSETPGEALRNTLAPYAGNELGDGSDSSQDHWFQTIHASTVWQTATWPLQNVAIGLLTSTTEVTRARVPVLLRVPAVVRALRVTEDSPSITQFDSRWFLGTFTGCPDERQDSEDDPCAGCPAVPSPECGASYAEPRIHWVTTSPRVTDADTLEWLREECVRHGVPLHVGRRGARVKDRELPAAWRDISRASGRTRVTGSLL